MIHDQVRRGIKIACINENTNIKKACFDSGVPKSAIYRYMGGKTDIYMTKLDTFCRLGLNIGLQDLLTLGEPR